jgi:hypothetical protein
MFRQPIRRPLCCRREERLLNGIFRRGEIAETADYGSENLRREFSQQVLEAGRIKQILPAARS